jgi:hypothetical protein
MLAAPNCSSCEVSRRRSPTRGAAGGGEASAVERPHRRWLPIAMRRQMLELRPPLTERRLTRGGTTWRLRAARGPPSGRGGRGMACTARGSCTMAMTAARRHSAGRRGHCADHPRNSRRAGVRPSARRCADRRPPNDADQGALDTRSSVSVSSPRFGGPEVHHQLELSRLLHGEVGGLRALRILST